MTAYAAEKGIKTAVENHGTFCQDSDRVELLVNTVAHDNFGLLVDMGNFLCADENPAAAVGALRHMRFMSTRRISCAKPPNSRIPARVLLSPAAARACAVPCSATV